MASPGHVRYSIFAPSFLGGLHDSRGMHGVEA
eukprot:CAMPEP_0197673824 /NCGR_PEP_ID=MMETSP1338-20131121/81730_1 /TAXON_ID=43686 ORGANISM="Pelagodinium beii, Strain RCC1491" /NCGR_SAMPLE_ID=MMETSP1338 /ASSEMBLY_ACC=CAM_ASM_000754 /LENGTH=31 /DNA_ID= /DNA_START= /DNA_END= /DNA_ORIENTATION=